MAVMRGGHRIDRDRSVLLAAVLVNHRVCCELATLLCHFCGARLSAGKVGNLTVLNGTEGLMNGLVRLRD